ncbi:MAG: choice-of-anchor Q domain-containing protein [Verrucomicrobiota bacterium]
MAGLLSGAAQAAVFTVTTLNGSGAGSLAQAVSDANAAAGADVVQFHPDLSGTITLAGGLFIRESVTINGHGTVTVSAGDLYPLLTITDENGDALQDIVIRGLHFTGGKLGDDPSSTNDFTASTTAHFGGISCRENLTLENVRITNSEGGISGIGKAAGTARPALILRNVEITGMITRPALLASQTSSILVEQSVFDSNNIAGTTAHANLSTNNPSITVRNSSFTNNKSSSYGGGMYINTGATTSTILMENTTFASNTVTGNACSGLAILNTNGTVTLRNCTLYDNVGNFAGTGHQAAFQGAPLTVNVYNSIIWGSSGADYGTQTAPTTLNFFDSVLGVNAQQTGTHNYTSTLQNTDPLLVASATTNGGPVKTVAFSSTSSPAINKGTVINGTTQDARGFVRNGAGGTVDAGAYERASATFNYLGRSLPVNKTTNASTSGNIAFSFGHAVTKGSGTLSLYNAASPGSPLLSFPVSFPMITLSGTDVQISFGSLTIGTTYYLTADAGAFLATFDGTPASSTAISSPSAITFTVGEPSAAPPTATVTSLVRAEATPTNATVVNWTLTFGSTVFGVTASHFTLGGTSTGAAVGIPTTANGGLTWTVPVTTGTDGTLLLRLDNDTGLSSDVTTTLPFVGETYTIDKTAPDTSITANPALLTTSTGASFSYTGSDAGSGVVSYQVKLDLGSFATGTSPTAYTSLADGSHTFQVRAVDAAGNVDASPASYTWTVDTTPPQVLSVTRLSPTGQAVSATTVTFRVTYSEAVALNAPATARYSVVPVGGSSITGTVTGVTGTGATRDVTVSITGGTGEFRLRVVD